MKNIILIFILLITFYSCDQVKFEAAQPLNTSSLKEFPKEIRGKYILTLLNFEQKKYKSDTLEIGENYYLLSDKKVKIYLSDTSTLKKYKNYFVFSYKEKKYWNVLLAKQQKNSNIFLYLILDDKGNKTAKKLSKTTLVNSTGNGKSTTRHYINPSKAEFKKIVKHGFFTKMLKMEKFE